MYLKISNNIKVILQSVQIQFITNFQLLFQRSLSPNLLVEILELDCDDESINRDYCYPVRYQHWETTTLFSKSKAINTMSCDLNILRQILLIPWLIQLLKFDFKKIEKNEKLKQTKTIQNLFVFHKLSHYFDSLTPNTNLLVLPIIVTKPYRDYIAIHIRLHWSLIEASINDRTFEKYNELLECLTYDMQEIKKITNLPEAQTKQCNEIMICYKIIMIDVMSRCIYDHKEKLPYDKKIFPKTGIPAIVYDIVTMPEFSYIEDTKHGKNIKSLALEVYNATPHIQSIKPISGILHLLYNPKKSRIAEKLEKVPTLDQVKGFLLEYVPATNVITRSKCAHV